MREWSGQRFVGGGASTQAEIPDEPVRLEQCEFAGSAVRVKPDATEHLRVSRATLTGCTISGGGLRGVALSESTVDGLRVRSLPAIRGCLFDRVVLRGRINQLVIDRDFIDSVRDPEPFYRAEQDFYASVEWALDIRELDSADFELRGVPGRLVRRDPEYQILVTRTRADEIGREALRAVDYGNTAFAYTLARMLRESWDDAVLVAPRTGKHAADSLAVLDRLRDAGVAEAD